MTWAPGARLFARKNIEVALANSCGPETLAALVQELGPSVFACSVQDAAEAETVLLAVPFPAHREVAKVSKDWTGRVLVDATNLLDNPKEEVPGVVSSEVIARAFAGARVVKAFNHLPVRLLGTNPAVEGQQQVVFVSSNDAEASTRVASLATRLGFSARSPRGVPPCTWWTASPMPSCFRTWPSSARADRSHQSPSIFQPEEQTHHERTH